MKNDQSVNSVPSQIVFALQPQPPVASGPLSARYRIIGGGAAPQDSDNTISILLGVAHSMTRYLIVALLLMASAASAQSGQPRQDPGCARDVARHCRSKMNDGDQVILACLKEHRAALS